MENCKLCSQLDKRRSADVPMWDAIFIGDYFDVVHAANTSLPGWTIIVLKRHLSTLDQLTEAESIELGILIRQVSLSLKHAVGCVKTYVMQFAEKAPHVHFHIVPRMAALEAQSRGPNVFNYMDVEPEESVPVDVRNEIAKKMRQVLVK